MRLISTNKLIDGMVVAKTIFRANGSILIKKGVKIKQRYIDKLISLGISQVYIEDTTYEHIDFTELTTNETKNKATNLVEAQMRTVAFNDNIDIKEIKEVVNQIVDELINSKDTLIELAEIRAVDDYTFGHCVSVGILSVVIGINMNYTRSDLVRLGLGAVLHDIGKAKVPIQVLNKPGKLTNKEYDIIKRHTECGYELLKHNTDLEDEVCHIALCHHERYDGRGYPRGIESKKLHEFVRIVSVADVYDALTSDRVYREQIETRRAVEYLLSMSNYQFDGNIVKQFIQSIAVYPIGKGVKLSNGKIGYVIGNNKKFPTRPIVRILYDNGKKVYKPYQIDLVKDNSVVIIDTTDEI